MFVAEGSNDVERQARLTRFEARAMRPGAKGGKSTGLPLRIDVAWPSTGNNPDWMFQGIQI
jgi:hypothetical protein